MIRQPLILSMLVATTALGFAGPPPGFEIIEVVRGPFMAISSPSLNQCGQAVFSVGYLDDPNSEIHLWDNGRLLQVTDNNYSDSAPDINDDGAMVWTIDYDGFFAGEIVLFHGGESRVLGDGSFPHLNNNGFVCWDFKYPEGCNEIDSDIMFWNGREVIALTDGGASNQASVINNSGQVAWTEFNFCNNPWTSDIVMYTDGESRELPSQHEGPANPGINDLGQVAWGSREGLQLWSDGDTTSITDWGRIPSLNNLGDIFFIRWHDDTSTWQGWLYQPDGSFLQLTDDSFRNTNGEINDDGEIVWRMSVSGRSDRGIRFMRRIRTGDSEFDGDIDLDDLAKLVDCMTGPMWVERTNPGPEDSLCDCRFLDINHDGSVDLRDYAIFQENFGG